MSINDQEMISLIINSTDIFSTVISKLIKIVIWSKMKTLFSIQKKKMIVEGVRCNLYTEWHVYWLFDRLKIMHWKNEEGTKDDSEQAGFP